MKKRIKRALDWLYREEDFVGNFLNIFFLTVLITFISAASIGFEKKLFETFFEVFVVGILTMGMVYAFYQILKRSRGWASLAGIFLLVGLLVGLITGDFELMVPIAWIVGVLMIGHPISMMVELISESKRRKK